jgi:hypothetical protein
MLTADSVTFLQWWGEAQLGRSRNQALKKARTHKYFARYHIVNEESKAIINLVSTAFFRFTDIEACMDVSGITPARRSQQNLSLEMGIR